ncbi:hypothetical protein ACVXG7_17815 [Enterobacter hormaechei]
MNRVSDLNFNFSTVSPAFANPMIPIDSGKNHRNKAAIRKMKSTFQENQKHHFILNSDKFFAVKLTFLIYAFRQLRTLFRVDQMDNAVNRHVFYISNGQQYRRGAGTRGDVAVSGIDKQHHAAVRGK